MVVRFDPKEDFKAMPEAKVWRDFATSTVFNKVATAGLLRYGDTLTSSGADDAANKFYKMQGAREFLGVLLNLTETVEVPTKTPVKSLNPNA